MTSYSISLRLYLQHWKGQSDDLFFTSKYGTEKFPILEQLLKEQLSKGVDPQNIVFYKHSWCGEVKLKKIVLINE